MIDSSKSAIDSSRTTWDLTPLLKNDDDPAAKTTQKQSFCELSWRKTATAHAEKHIKAFAKKWNKRTDYLRDPRVLKTALDEYEELLKYYVGAGNVGFYFGLRSYLDMDNPALRAKCNKIDEFASKMSNEIEFFTHRLAKVPQATQKIFLKSPHLALYRHALECSFKAAKYLLSEPEEKLITRIANPACANWVEMTSRFLSKEERVVLTVDGKKKQNFAEITALMNSTNKKVRDSAAAAFNEILEKHSDTAEVELNSILEFKKTLDEMRNIPRPDFPRHLADDIDTEVVDTLIKTASAHNDLAKRFYALKAKLLGVKKLAYHERNVPYGRVDKEYTYADALAIVEKVFSGLDAKFANIIKSFAKNGLIDVHPKKGKLSGACCIHNLITQPTYILLNFTGKLEDIRTIAHEFGHGINNELMRVQRPINFDTPLSTAEVASTFMEDFVLEELASGLKERQRLSIYMDKLNADVSSIFRQVACYQFEQALHKEFNAQGYLSKQEIGALFQKYMAGYMGPAVEQSAGAENWWVYWSHIRHFFYNYSYANGLLISKALQSKVRADPKFIAQVKQFLAAGSSDSPKNIFKKLGIDITKRSFWEQGIAEVEELLEKAEGLAGKLGK